jgi:predicted regulator of Ras-like GTPase activity (Roadblock/LC7/MglB family)
MILFDEEFNQIKQIISRLRIDANAKMVFLVDRSGQQIAAQGDVEGIDVTGLASLTAGTVAATDGLAQILGEKEFNGIFHEGRKESLHISLVGDKIILVISFDDRSSLGLVRLRVKRATADLIKVFDDIAKKSEREKESLETAGFESPFAEITDEDIDSLFSE